MEVIKSIRWLANELRDEKRGFEAKICRVAADRLEKLGKRDEPMEPIRDGVHILCPACRENKSLLGLYCDNCGQKIDWGD